MKTIYNAQTLEMIDIKKGDKLFIEPLETLPNFERTIITQGVSDGLPLPDELWDAVYEYWQDKCRKETKK